MDGKTAPPSPTAIPDSDVMLAASFGGSDGNSDYVESDKNSPTIPYNTPDIAGHISELGGMQEVAEGELDTTARPTVLFSHTDELEIQELAVAKTNPHENRQDDGAMTPVNTQFSPTHSSPEDTLVFSTKPPPCPRIKAGDAALQARKGDLPDVRLLVTDYILYGVYQDWVHQNPGDHLDGGTTEYSKWKAR